jgi:hypothetical protein
MSVSYSSQDTKDEKGKDEYDSSFKKRKKKEITVCREASKGQKGWFFYLLLQRLKLI